MLANFSLLIALGSRGENLGLRRPFCSDMPQFKALDSLSEDYLREKGTPVR